MAKQAIMKAEEAKASGDMEILFGGGTDKSKGYFIEPTVVQSHDPRSRLMREEIFGPVLSIMKFETEEEALAIANDTAYGLTNYVQTPDGARRNRGPGSRHGPTMRYASRPVRGAPS